MKLKRIEDAIEVVEWAIDYRHNEYFKGIKDELDKKYGLMNKRSFFRRLTRKIFYRNFLFHQSQLLYFQNHLKLH